MSTALWMLLLAVTWSSVGLIVALFLGRILRGPSRVHEDVINRLIC